MIYLHLPTALFRSGKYVVVRAFAVRRPGGRLCKVFLVAAAALETDIKFYCSCCHGFSRRSWGCLLARGGGGAPVLVVVVVVVLFSELSSGRPVN